jgi:hypothetical protein
MLHVQQPEVLRVSRASRLGVALLCGFGLAAAAQQADAVTLDDLKGASLQTRATYDMRIRRAEGDFTTQATHVMRFKIDGEGRISGQVNRTVTTPRGPRTRSHPMDASIGKPGESPVGGDRLWLIDGDKLILLRAFDAGGFKAEIEFKGSGNAMTCSFRAPFVREDGKNTRMKQSVVGGPVTILSATQTSSDCRITR